MCVGSNDLLLPLACDGLCRPRLVHASNRLIILGCWGLHRYGCRGIRARRIHPAWLHDSVRVREGSRSTVAPGPCVRARAASGQRIRKGVADLAGRGCIVRVWPARSGHRICLHVGVGVGGCWIRFHRRYVFVQCAGGRMTPRRALSVLLIFIGAYHALIGICLMFSVTFQHFAVNAYGASFTFGVRDVYFIRIIGSFVLVLGCVALGASRDPVTNWPAVLSFVEFFVLRDISRHMYSGELYAAFNVSRTINVVTSPARRAHA